ncbi:MAG: agmatine/peptidylarginine deiminase, partial [Actinomycetota bacterium]
SVLCNSSDLEMARAYLDARVEIIEAELDDAWMRDIAPTFVRTSEGKIAAVDWIFNGWGAQRWAKWERDSKVGGYVAKLSGAQLVESLLINEGGGIHVNGKGVVLLTETVQLGDGRNSNWSKQKVEEEIHRVLGTECAIWIKRGLTRDYDEFGTRGHIDIVACFSDENTILYHDQQNPNHPDFEISKEVRGTLEAAGNFNLIPVPAPEVLRDDEGFVDYSYINHYIVNGAVILCSFNDPADQKAKAILQECYPGREIVLLDARELFARGGGIHCITQQQPA